MSVLLLMLKSGEELIAETKELLLEEKVIGFQLTNPQVLSLSRATTLNEETEEEKKAHEEFEALGERALAVFEGKDAIYTQLQVKQKDDGKNVIGISRFQTDLLKFVGSEIAEWARKTLN